MQRVPRHLFVEPALASRAYEDVALPIGHGQTISRPSTVARMLETVMASLPQARRAQSKALEIGTGCGYQAALMAELFGEVVSIERVRGLHDVARENLRPMRLANLRLMFGDAGWARRSPPRSMRSSSLRLATGYRRPAHPDEPVGAPARPVGDGIARRCTWSNGPRSRAGN
jgi:protein-L-isoaspartate(D-aspartate) O-methyltransferase